MPLISVVVMAVPVISSELCSLSLGFHCQHVCQIMEMLPAFPRQTKPRELPNAHHSPLRSFEPGKHWTFLWDGVSRAREQVRSCWYGNKFCSLLLVCFLIVCVCVCVVCSSVGLQHWESGRAAGLLWDQAQRLGGGWVRLREELHTHALQFLFVLACHFM